MPVSGMNPDALIYVAGHGGLVGSALVRTLRARGYDNLVLRDRAQLDLTDQAAVAKFFCEQRPEYVFLAAAKVGGIKANDTLPGEFIRDNLLIQANVIDSAYRAGTRKLLFLGSSCIYPKNAPQPLKEEYLLTGSLEQTNEWYAVAKIAGLKMCQAYRKQYGFDAISAMPTNLYGPGDNFNLENSHVLPALIRKYHEAKVGGASEVEIWGSGRPRREFLHVDDLADACMFLMNNYDEDGWINVGFGSDITVAALSEIIGKMVGFGGSARFDTTRPDGTARKLLDTSRIRSMGWSPRIGLEEGVRSTYEWFLRNRLLYRC